MTQNIPSKLAKASIDTYRTFEPWSNTVAFLFVLLHISHSLFNYYANESEPLMLRIAAIAIILPYVAVGHFKPGHVAQALSKIFLYAIALSGPVFLFGGWLYEITEENPNAITLVQRQYEFVAALGILLIASANALIALVFTLASCLVIFAAFAAIGTFQFQALEASWAPLLSVYLIISIAVVMGIKSRSEAAQQKAETIAAVGSSIAHELRTPLLSIRTAAKSLHNHITRSKKDDYHLPNGGTRTISTATNLIIDEVNSASTIIDIFLTNASGLQNIVKKGESIFSVTEAIDEAIRRYPYRSERERKAVHFSANFAGHVNGSRLLFVHVIFNLMKNGFEHLGLSMHPRLLIELHPDFSSLRVSITDNGSGINPTDLTNIFDPFFSTSNRTRTGIGLAFCKSAIEGNFGGAIWGESDGSNGSTFFLHLPLANQKNHDNSDQNRSS